MSKVLAIDASAPVGGVALRSGDASWTRELPGQRRHAEALMPLVRDVMQAGAVSWNALNAVAAGAGPGSFTGIRVGLAAAQGLAAAHEIPVAGIGSLDILARACYDERRLNPQDRVVAVQDVRRGEVAMRMYAVTPRGVRALSAMELVPEASLGSRLAAAAVGAARCWVSGDGETLVTKFPEMEWFNPTGAARALALARLTQSALLEGVLPAPAPVYARSANAVPRKTPS